MRRTGLGCPKNKAARYGNLAALEPIAPENQTNDFFPAGLAWIKV